MYLILCIGGAGFMLALQRFFVVFIQLDLNTEAFTSQIRKLVRANNIDRAIKLCNAAPGAAVTKVFKAGLTHANKDARTREHAIKEAVRSACRPLKRGTPYLPMIACVVVFLGLLASAQRLAFSSDAIAQTNPEAHSSLLASAISTAMSTTIFGLGLGIAIVIMHSLVRNRSEKIIDDVEDSALVVIGLLQARSNEPDED